MEKLLSIKEAAELAGFSRRSLERLLSLGEGPVMVRLSERRLGIFPGDFAAWLESRRRPAKSAPATAATPHRRGGRPPKVRDGAPAA